MERLFTKEEIAKQRELDKVAKEKEWEALAKEAGGDERGAGIADAFKQLYTLYTPALAEWFAKLYDPEVGGYYSTTSGHDTEGFGPDVEVTVQSLRFIESSGMLTEDELVSAKKVLTAAAMTYVAALASSLTTLLRLILLAGGGRRRR